jgi:hypothetical protein
MTKKYELRLADSLFDCPKHWQNFIKTHNPDGETTDEMHSFLKSEYNAEIDDEVHKAIFEDEADYILFKLRWTY